MKKKNVRRALIAVLSLVLLAASIVPSLALYNDIALESYVNMSSGSAIPNLFRNDAVFPSYKKYPPIISDGIEYVPLEIFYGLSDVKISFSDDKSNFYIQNKKNNRYISFNVQNNYAVTGKGEVFEVLVPSFYNVYYVPLRTVCNATGIGCDSYNDGINKLYVIKVFTAPGLSAKELIKIHAPSIYGSETDNGEQTPPDNPPPEKDDPPKVDDPKPPIVVEEFPSRTIYMFFGADDFENASKTLDVLSNLGYRALFAVRAEDMIKYPDSVRRIITAGHTMCLDIPEYNEAYGTVYDEGVLEAAVKIAQETLYDITKTKARLAIVESNDNELYINGKIPERLDALGLGTYKINIDSDTDNLPINLVHSNLTSKIKGLYGTKGHANAYIAMYHTDSGRQALYTVYDLARKNAKVGVGVFTEVD